MEEEDEKYHHAGFELLKPKRNGIVRSQRDNAAAPLTPRLRYLVRCWSTSPFPSNPISDHIPTHYTRTNTEGALMYHRGGGHRMDVLCDLDHGS